MGSHKIAADGHAADDLEASRKPTRVSVNSDPLEKTQELGVDLATTLAVELQRKTREGWLEENREAIEAYNQHVAEHGVFSTACGASAIVSNCVKMV